MIDNTKNGQNGQNEHDRDHSAEVAHKFLGMDDSFGGLNDTNGSNGSASFLAKNAMCDGEHDGTCECNGSKCNCCEHDEEYIYSNDGGSVLPPSEIKRIEDAVSSYFNIDIERTREILSCQAIILRNIMEAAQQQYNDPYIAKETELAMETFIRSCNILPLTEIMENGAFEMFNFALSAHALHLRTRLKELVAKSKDTNTSISVSDIEQILDKPVLVIPGDEKDSDIVPEPNFISSDDFDDDSDGLDDDDYDSSDAVTGAGDQ